MGKKVMMDKIIGRATFSTEFELFEEYLERDEVYEAISAV